MRRIIVTGGLQLYGEDEFNMMLSKKVVSAFRTGKFSSGLPEPYVFEITNFAKQCLSEGKNKMVLMLLTRDGGAISFLYDLETNDTSISISKAIDWHVGRTSKERSLPPSMEQWPRKAIDVSMK
jgi:hypothetical protein